MDELCPNQNLKDFWSDMLSKVGGGANNKIDNIIDKTDKIANTADKATSQITWIVENGKPYFIAFGALVVAKLITGILHDVVEIKHAK